MSTIETLQAVRNLLSKPENWIKGNYAAKESKPMNTCAATDPAAVMWCIHGALWRCGQEMDCGPERLLVAQLPISVRHNTTLMCFNDAPTTTHADILALIDRAIAAAQ